MAARREKVRDGDRLSEYPPAEAEAEAGVMVEGSSIRIKGT